MSSGKRQAHILVTGGAGYIGTHTLVELLSCGYRLTVVDNLDNSSEIAIQRVREISGCSDESIKFHIIDLLDLEELHQLFRSCEAFDACVHFAGLKAVGESVQMPLHYYSNNIQGTINLLHCLDRHGCRKVVFSSSATVYGDPEFVPLTETHPLRSTNPYGKTKLFIEEIMRDVEASRPGEWFIALLRYFNPIGAHPSGLIGEDPVGAPNNLVPFVSQVAVGRQKKLKVFGNDYDTRDGTGVRDYIHVVDLAQGHVAAVEKILSWKKGGVEAYNLGTGKGTTVMEVIDLMKKASGRPIEYEITTRRDGDVATCFANPEKATRELEWTAKFTVEDGIASAWNWQKKNPLGYLTPELIESRNTCRRPGKVFSLFGNPNTQNT